MRERPKWYKMVPRVLVGVGFVLGFAKYPGERSRDLQLEEASESNNVQSLSSDGEESKLRVTEQPASLTIEDLNKLVGICGFSGDLTGARAWFELVGEEEAPPLGLIRVISGGEDFGYDLVEQAIGNQITGEYYVPELADCKEIGLREGKVWLFRGLTPKGRFVSTPVPKG